MTGFVNEILGDDRLWDTGWPETALTGWPLPYEIANLAILNRTTDKKVYLRTFNSRPYSGPCGLFPLIQIGRITGYTGGQTVTPISHDTNNAAPAVEVKYRPSSVTETANTRSMTQWVNTGMNLTRTQQWSRWQGQGQKRSPFDSTEMGNWYDSGAQKITLREGEGIGLFFSQNSGPNIFMISAFVKGGGGTFLYNHIVEPLYMNGACFAVIYNPAGSGDVFYVSRLQAREVGSDEVPMMEFFKICSIFGQPESAQVVWADTSEATPNIDVKKNCTVLRHGLDDGAIITAPRMRRIIGGEAPYGPGVANGGSVARRGKLSHDMRFTESATILKLGPGEGIAAVLRNPSAYAYSEFVANFAVEDICTGGTGGGTYPDIGDVQESVTYGPTGADYTGNLVVPTTTSVYTGVGYGALGVEFSGNLTVPSQTAVVFGIGYGGGGVEYTGTYVVPTPVYPTQTSVRAGTHYGDTGVEYTGTIALPSATAVETGISYGADGTEVTGTLSLPSQTAVVFGIGYGGGGAEYTGSFVPVYPTQTSVRAGTHYGDSGVEYTGTIALPSATSVEDGISYGADGTEVTGTLTLPSQTAVVFGVGYGGGGAEYTGSFDPVFPSVTNVRSGISYGETGLEYTGTIYLPSVSDVRAAISFGAGGTESTGNMTLPIVGNVRVGISYGANGTELTGTLVPSGAVGGGGNRIFYPGGWS